MIKWAIIFAVIGLIAGALGFGGIAGGAIGIAKFLFVAALVIAGVLFLLGVTIFKKVSSTDTFSCEYHARVRLGAAGSGSFNRIITQLSSPVCGMNR